MQRGAPAGACCQTSGITKQADDDGFAMDAPVTPRTSQAELMFSRTKPLHPLYSAEF